MFSLLPVIIFPGAQALGENHAAEGHHQRPAGDNALAVVSPGHPFSNETR
jgi:hypothetical protein